ncbi:pseudouridine synthase [Shewanella sp. OMA3-2]|uniref:pseudouridine synthase n=1 Tax=Shewanella sp. OMA3-2 TaxID=2908650 RepID=UPI001F18F888|nr:pseudouridine synthase [Shewanella sp. OMA3-2]UJF21809.1 pseudouridine synthase [Shewanella sp. OMA3-2]
MVHYRLAHYLALCGIASRRQCCRIIDANRVTINGQVATHSAVIEVDVINTDSVNDIRVDGVKVGKPEAKVYWLYHKPVGVDCRLIESDPSSLLHHLPKEPRLYPAGRLDKDSRGLLLLTNDGQLTQQLLHPGFQHSKTYHVSLDTPFDALFLATMAAGVTYQQAGQSITTRTCQMTSLTSLQFAIVLTQGLNRQIRKMCQTLGYRVIDLKRVAIGGVELGQLAETKRRPLTAAELSMLVQRIRVT